MLLVLVCARWSVWRDLHPRSPSPKLGVLAGLHYTLLKMVDAARSARASPGFQTGMSTCFTKRPWQVPRALHPAELALEAIPSLRSWDP
jgi:hypothetical protein